MVQLRSKVVAMTAARMSHMTVSPKKLARTTGTTVCFVAQLRVAHRDVDGDYNAKSVTHRFDSSGYTTNVSLEAGDTTADE
jgi:hypothetical protein